MKTIWIIDHYSSEPKFGGIKRQYDFAMELSNRGFNVVIISSGFSHFTHSYISEEEMYVSEIAKSAHYVYLKTTSYSANGGIQRAKNMFSFLHQVMKYEKKIASMFGQPDVVNGCSVHPLAWVAAYKISRKYKIRLCIEVRDFWPRIWVVGEEKKKTDPMVIFFAGLEKWAYKKADRIIYSMSQGDKYICGELGIAKEKVQLIGQPMACEQFDRQALQEELLPKDIQTFIKSGFTCVFAGYYMEYEGVYVMLEAAKKLQQRGVPINMLFVGSGEEYDGMKDYVTNNQLASVMVYGRIPKEAVPALLSRCEICMAHLEVKNHPEVYKYGVSKNKVNEYLYSGAYTLYGFWCKEDAVDTSRAGAVFEPYNSDELANMIEKVFKMPEEERRMYGCNGREFIRNNHSVEKLTDMLLNVFFE